jgi:hypothetical protein
MYAWDWNGVGDVFKVITFNGLLLIYTIFQYSRYQADRISGPMEIGNVKISEQD